MTIEEALIEFGRELICPPNEWYKWRKINPRFLPEGVSVSGGNSYFQNESLKKQLSEQYWLGTDERKIEITRYYIAVWGGVRRNRPEKIRGYALNPPSSLIEGGVSGVASWSKALCIRDPNRYAIYDARVSVSLNALQIIYSVQDPVLFPLLVGQNKLINKGSDLLIFNACQKAWGRVSEASFYNMYNALLEKVACSLKVEHYTVEMALFAKALELLKSAFPKENF